MSDNAKVEEAIKLIGDEPLRYFYPASQRYGDDAYIGCDASLDGCPGIDNNDPVLSFDQEKDICFFCVIKLFESTSEFHPVIPLPDNVKAGNPSIPNANHILNYGYLTYSKPADGICMRCKKPDRQSNRSLVLKSEMGELCLKCVEMMGRCLKPLAF
jgi:hypothetical protein